MPKEYSEDNGVFIFENDGIEYYVRFEPFKDTGQLMVPDDEILNKINNLDNKYIIDFGIVEDGSLNYSVKTNKNNPIKIIKYITGIVLKFIEDNEVNVLSYVPNSDIRDRMFNKLVENFAKDFTRYRAKENPSYNVFLIKNTL